MMSSVSLPAPFYLQTGSASNPQIRIRHKPSLDKNLGGITTSVSSHIQSPHPHPKLQPLIPAIYPSRQRQRGLSLATLDAKINSGSEQEDSGALETVLKLYSAIRNKNLRELSDIIDDECQCICNFFSSFQPLQGKKQVLDFFTSLIKYLGNHIEFVVKPTLHDGMVVGIHWRLEWSKIHMPLGKGFSIYTCQVYHGKVMIRNVEMFMEPLLHVEPFRLKMIGYLTTIIEKISSSVSSKALKREILRALLALLFITTILLFTMLY